MSNKEVARLFFEGKKDHAKTGNMFYEGNAMYSYGYHYLMAYKVPEKKIVFVNANTYSNTTTRHLSHTRWEARQAGYTVIETYKMKQVADDLARSKQREGHARLSHELYIEVEGEIFSRISKAEAKEKRARIQWSKESWQRVQEEERKQSQALIDKIGETYNVLSA